MNHMGTKTLETDRLILRKFEIADVETYAPVYFEREIIAAGEPVSQQQIDSLRERIEYFSATDKYYWGIAEKHSGNLIGEAYCLDAKQMGKNKAVLNFAHYNMEEFGMQYMAICFSERIWDGNMPAAYVQSGDMYNYVTRK